jgi:ribonuclease E
MSPPPAPQAEALAVPPEPTPVAAAPAGTAAEPPATRPVAATPTASLDQVVSSAGLEWVQTQPRAGNGVTAAEETPAPRVGRVRRPRQAPAAEPLQQVETRSDSSPG